MSQVENQVPDNEPSNEPQDTPAINSNPIEDRARELGWVPKEEYHGDETNWLDAGEFVRRQPLFEKIERQNRELKEIKKTLNEFAKHHQNVREAEYKRALKDLQEAKIAAFEEGDARAIVEIDEQIKVTEKAAEQFEKEQAQQAKQEAQAIHPEFEAWTNRNPWYLKDEAMRVYADTVGRQVAMSKQGITPAEVLKEVEKAVRSNFPTVFKNPAREKPGAVETGSRGNNSKGSGYVPNDFERRVAEKFVRQGVYKNVDEYYKELQLINGKS